MPTAVGTMVTPAGATRTVQIRFDAAGAATVRVVGANGTTAERSVVVRSLR